MKGEYINGEINGKVIEYFDNGDILFEGQYSNGLRKKGKEFGKDRMIVFDGEYLNGNKLKGKSYEYNFNSVNEFDGDYLNGQKWNGKITEYNKDNREIVSKKELKNGIVIENNDH